MSDLPNTLEALQERGLTLSAVSKLVGCSYVTLYRAKKGVEVNASTVARLESLRLFSTDESVVVLLLSLAKTCPADKIWQVGLAQIIEENKEHEPA